MCGCVCWGWAPGTGGAGTGRWPATSSCVGSWRRPARVRSVSWIRWVPGRCCAATGMRGSARPDAAGPVNSMCGFRGGAAAWWRSRWYGGTFTLDGRRLRLPVAAGCAPLWLRLDRDLPYPAEAVRSVTLLNVVSRLFVEVAAEVPVAVYPDGLAPDPARVAGVDLGIIYPYAVAGPGGQALLVSGRAIRAEHRMHLADTNARRRATARRAPAPGQRGSRRWPTARRMTVLAAGCRGRRIRRPRPPAASRVLGRVLRHRVATPTVGDPR